MAWTSSDGTAWRAVPAGSGLDGSTVERIVGVGSQLVALGQSTSGGGAAWLYADGSSWTRLATSDLFNRADIAAVASVNGRLVLFGVNASGQAILAAGAW